MSNKGYDEETVVKQLSAKHDIRINTNIGVISILKDPDARNDIGIKSKGKIDFLTRFCKYKINWTHKL